MTEYKRCQGKSYMVLGEDSGAEGYEIRMLTRNEIPGLLPMKITEGESGTQYWYEISGRNDLESWSTVHKLGSGLLQSLISSLQRTVRQAGEFLLDEAGISLEPSRIFLGFEEDDIRFCYMPFEKKPLSDSLQGFMEYFLQHMEHGSQEEIQKCYEVYDRCQGENVALKDLLAVLLGGEDIMPEEGEAAPEERSEGIARQDVHLDKKKRTFSTGADARSFLRGAWQRAGGKATNVSEKADSWTANSVGKTGADRSERGLREMISDGWWKNRLQSGLNSSLRNGWKNDLNRVPKSGLNGFLKNGRNGSLKGGPKAILRRKKAAYDIPCVFGPEEQGEETAHPTVFLGSETPAIIGELRYEGNGREQNLRISQPSFLIGNQKGEVDGIVHASTVSRIHARITREGEDYYLEDMNSTNGTYRNGELLNYREKVLLEKNDSVAFADEAYRFV